MANVAVFGDQIHMSLHASTCDTIFDHIRKYAPDSDELMELVALQEVFDAQGCWFFNTLSLPALERLMTVLEKLEANLPKAISNWSETSRPLFHANFAEFKQKLAERIAQLRRDRYFRRVCFNTGYETKQITPSADLCALVQSLP